jgi:hypothetical protein
LAVGPVRNLLGWADESDGNEEDHPSSFEGVRYCYIPLSYSRMAYVLISIIAFSCVSFAVGIEHMMEISNQYSD